MTSRLRIDKWLWHARFYRTRALSQAAARSGVIRLNGQRVGKAGTDVRPGDLLTLPRGPGVIVVRILACGTRRGPAGEARTLYEEVTG
ncbi:MAG TPA: RNA-binding S4 domain-containing protein [Rhizomicrobium sp.]|nr:RNA-binding S4 domain-containing protein [Rhizomicrobium sp.]